MLEELTARVSNLLRLRMASDQSDWVFPEKNGNHCLATSLKGQHSRVRSMLGLPRDFVLHSMQPAGVVESVDTEDLKSSSPKGSAGSSPALGMSKPLIPSATVDDLAGCALACCDCAVDGSGVAV